MRYVAAKQQPEPDRARLRKLEIEIEGLDTQIRIAYRVPRIAAAVVRYYYGLNMDSVSIAAELGVKPPAVRMILWRLRRTWEQMQQPRVLKASKPPMPPKARKRHIDAERIARLLREKRTVEEIATEFGRSIDEIYPKLRALWHAGVPGIGAILAEWERRKLKAMKSRAQYARWGAPGARANHAAAMSAAWERPEMRTRHAEATRAALARPEIKARHSAGLRAAWARRKMKKAGQLCPAEYMNKLRIV